MSKKKTWIKKRHAAITGLADKILTPYCRKKYGLKINYFKREKNARYLILYNHQTPFDQFFVGMTFGCTIYYVASEDIFSTGFLSALLRYAVAPIPIRKGSKDIRAVKDCLRVAKEGGSIAIAPEGNRTYSGETGYMSDSIVRLARLLKLPVAFVRIEGGFGVQPRWGEERRKGKMQVGVSAVLSPEEYGGMSDDEFFARIRKELYRREGYDGELFESEKRAEYIERAMYVCPWCGLSEFHSEGNSFSCKKCGASAEYGKDKRIVGINCDFPFEDLPKWYRYQTEVVKALDPSALTNDCLYRDTVDLYDVILYKKKKRTKRGATLALFGDRIEIDGEKLFFSDIDGMSVLGKNKLNIRRGDKYLQIKGEVRFNALKYLNFYCHSENIRKGEQNDEFLGI